jgi:hypothetical protein
METLPEWVISLQHKLVEASIKNESIDKILKQFCQTVCEKGVLSYPDISLHKL